MNDSICLSSNLDTWLNAEIDWDNGAGDSPDLSPDLPRFRRRYLDVHR